MTSVVYGATSTVQGITTNPLNRSGAVETAFAHFYNLDYDGAIQRFQKIEAEHPNDPIAVDYVLDATIFRNLYALDLLDTTLYAHDGFLSNKHPVAEDKAISSDVNMLSEKAIGLANDRLVDNSKDADALFARAWAKSLKATYIALVQHSYVAALRLALQARGDDDKVLGLDPNYVDAELVVGIHQYVVGSLPRAFKLFAGVAGIHGDKQKGIAMLRDAGQRGVITSVEARTALALFLRREGKYDQAAAVAQSLKDQYPHDFLFWLEEANLRKDAGDANQAIAGYRALLQQAKKPGYFPNAHMEMAWFGLAETLRGQGQSAAAAAAFRGAVAQPSISPDLKRRAQLGLGMEYDLLHQREKAVQQYEAVLNESPGSAQADDAKKYMKSPYKG